MQAFKVAGYPVQEVPPSVKAWVTSQVADGTYSICWIEALYQIKGGLPVCSGTKYNAPLQMKAKTFLGHPKLIVGFFVGYKYNKNEKALNNQGFVV